MPVISTSNPEYPLLLFALKWCIDKNCLSSLTFFKYAYLQRNEARLWEFLPAVRTSRLNVEVIDELAVFTPHVPLFLFEIASWGNVMVNSLRLIENNLNQWLIGFNNCTRAFNALKSFDLKKNYHPRFPEFVGVIEF